MALIPGGPREQRLVAIAVIAIALAALYYAFIYSPKAEELAVVETHLEQLNAGNDLAKKEMAKGSVDQLRTQAEESRRNLELMRQLVPTGNEVPALLEQVSTAARRAGLEIASVEPEPVIEGDQFDTYRYRVRVIGGFHPIAEFLSNVGGLTRIMAPINLRLTSVTNPGAVRTRARAGQSLLDANFQLQTYVARTGGSATSSGEVR